ncbi:TolC family protein [Ideonella sp.]|uniref:TolC family protein n=1 Tax=Ideonella sp. TaxID=1929293 RepID=UPI0035AFEE40
MTRMHGRAAVAGLAIVLAFWASAGARAAVTLSQAVDAAWPLGTVAAEAAGQARRAQAGQTAASAWWAAPPSVELGTLRNRQAGRGAASETEVGVALSLWLPGQRAAHQAQGDAELALATTQAQLARWRLAGTVRDAAAEVALQRADVAAAHAQAQELSTLAADVARRVAAGELARADALGADAERLAAATALAQARQRLLAAERQWAALTGLPEVVDLPVDAPAAASAGHPALAAAAAEVAVARHRLQVARASRRDAPELVLSARHEAAPGEPDVRGVGVALRVPFGSASRNEPLLAAALSEVELAEAAERALQRQVQAEQDGARAAETSARQQWRDEQARAALLRERASLIDKSFRAGETALPDMLRALTAATQAEAAAARARAVFAQAVSRLEQALGAMP